MTHVCARAAWGGMTVRWSTSTPTSLLSGAEVLVDGTSVAKVAAQHTLKIVLVGTSGRPTVTADGIAVLD
ncbi:hypothetical protein [Streptomyces sp. NPDC001781]